LRTYFKTCVGDRSALEHSKKKAVLLIVNNLFKSFFELNTIHLCNNLISTVEGSGFPSLNEYPISELVTYKFYSGQLSAFSGEYIEAQKSLSLAFQRCPVSHTKNKRLILLYLIPVEMLLGRLPKPELLKKYSLTQFLDVVNAVKTGNMGEFNRGIDANEEFFVQKGIYLLLEKVRILTYRNLFKRIYIVQGKSDKISIDKCLAIFKWMKIDTDGDEIECILANLIYNGMIKGYLSHKFRCMVVSQKGPFPKITKTFSNK